MINLMGACGLLNISFIHHDNPVAHCHRFRLIMRHINDGRFQTLMELADFGAHRHSQFRV